MNNPRFHHRFMYTSLLCFAAISGAKPAEALSDEVAQLRVIDAWQPQMPAVVPVSAGYLTLLNQSDRALEIINVSSPEFESVEIHRSVLKHDSVSMEPVATLILASGETVRFQPHGLHLMLRHPRITHEVGNYYPVILHLGDGRIQAFDMQVVATDCERCGGEAKVDHRGHVHHGH